MDTKTNKGIIVLGGHVQALGIIRILGQEGIPSIIIDNTPRNIACHSKYCQKSFTVAEINLLSFLVDLGEKGVYSNWVIFPTNDFHVKLLSTNKKELENYFIVSADNWDSVKIFYNKQLTYRLAQKLNIPIAKTFFPSSENELKNIDIEYPCIIKPAVMYDFYKQVKKKVFICKSYDDLIQKYRLALQFIPPEEVIIQEIIKGSSKNQFSACFLFLNNKTYVQLTACRLRQHPLDFGNATTYAETIDLPLLVELGERILGAASYNGVCEVEFKKDDRDSEYKFLEVNTRTWKWHTIAIKADTPFLGLFYKHLIGTPIEKVEKFSKASFRHGLTDISVQARLLVRGEKHWSRMKKPVQAAVWSNHDIMPWVFEKINLFSLIWNR
ncbi:MAG: hypothetical protein Q7U54_12420 [Bacteroidales bacterium]|nr:hypothetical protein [Bacteroidales bacterium]